MDSASPAATALPTRALVLLIRGLAPHYLGVYGNEWVWSRTCDRLAARGVVFDQHYAVTNEENLAWIDQLARSAVKTLIAKVRPEAANSRRAFYNQIASIPETQPALVFVDCNSLAAPWNVPTRWLDHYFEVDDEEEPLTPWLEPLPATVADDDMAERLQVTFAAIVSTVDTALAKLLAGCRQRGFGSNALIVVTSDLAQPLGEQEFDAGAESPVCESIHHLPLIMRLPERQAAGKRISALTEPADLTRTLLQYFGIAPDGPTLWPLVADQTDGWREHLVINTSTERAVRTADRLLIHGEPPRLYLKPEDRWEVNDLAIKMEDEVDRLMALLNLAAK